ncbi:4-coumarate-CoA ligase [Exophiala aquamarina CBS 119918]|uniref:4-coumarate-CoA ligase n=1 Tax=Exophiala aquamarina CBS 119918 TaxID=1182545 RepID=A0A072PJL1_9EURO|nr:4-coumarate-CoA ligase [Exophiala aquamarina CBS 119918]KEF59508.1 4-coumarate-CoA ligase [Exophiala aquamarina CBS 119918]
MPYKSRWQIEIPRCSLPTFLFGSSANLPHSPSNPNKVCLADAARPNTHFFTRATYQLWCQRFALGLQQSGLFKEGDRLLLFSPNNIFVPVVFLGTLLAGGIFTGANPSFTPRELAYQLRDSEASLLLCHSSITESGIQAAKRAGLDLSRVFVFDDAIFDGTGSSSHGLWYWSQLVSPNLEQAEVFAWNDLTGLGECNTTLALNYSSGTTGLPKGVEVTHLNYLANTLQTGQTVKNHLDYEKRSLNSASLAYLPLYHAYGQTVYIALYFHHERTAYVMPKFDFIKMLEYTEKFKVSDMNLVPPIALALAKYPDLDKYDLSSVTFLGCGAAPLSRDIAEQVEKRLNKNRKEEDRLNLRQGWGMTECTCSLLYPDINEEVNTNTVGEPNANCEAMIVDEGTGKEITARGPEARGELWCRGENVMKGYWRNPKATAETLTPGGWLKTGDIAYVSEKGHFVIVDRIKELIKVQGHQVAPAELEALLLEHPAVLDVAVVGVSRSDGDEEPRAFVVKQGKVTEKEIQDFTASKVVRYKHLTGGVTFIDEIPRNPSGKILRRQIKERCNDSVRTGARL